MKSNFSTDEKGKSNFTTNKSNSWQKLLLLIDYKVTNYKKLPKEEPSWEQI